MKRPERQFWTYIALLSSVLLLGLSGQLISCAKAETTRAPRDYPRDPVHPVAQPGAPWNQDVQRGPTIGSDAKVRVDAQLDRGSVLQHSSGLVRMEVRLDTLDHESARYRSDSDIVVVIDTSGSMEGQKLHFAKQALYELFDRLGPNDRFGLVEYGSEGRTLVPLQHATQQAKVRFQGVASSLVATGATNMAAGLDLGAGLLGGSPASRPSAGRLILLSDGLANSGDSSHAGLTSRARHLSLQGVALSTMGIGSDFDEQLMTDLATAGTGAFYYLAHLEYLSEFLEAELTSGQQTYAYAANLHLHTFGNTQLIDAMGLDIQSRGAEQVIRIGNLYAGRSRSVWLTLRVPTDRLGSLELGQLSLSFEREGYPNHITAGRLPQIVCLNDYIEFERRVKKDIWERALLNNVFTKTEEDFGDAIRSGDTQVIARALREAESERKLAQSLGSRMVLEKLDDLKGEAASARLAQQAPAPARTQAAKKAKARGYQMRNKDAYQDADQLMKAY